MSVSVVVFVLNGLSFIIQFPKGGKLAVNWWGNSVYLDSKSAPLGLVTRFLRLSYVFL